MLATLLLVTKIAISIVLIALLFDNNKRKVMNQYCYSECVEGKHYREKGNMYNIY